MTEAQLTAQRRSFAFGNCAIGNPSVTRELIEAADEAMQRAHAHVRGKTPAEQGGSSA